MYDLSNLKITPEMLNIIAEIDEFKGAWRLLGRLAPERLLMLRKVATIESIGSSTRIEGAKLSDKEVEKLLSNIKSYSFRSRDEQEVAGYSFACEEIFNSYDAIPFTENIIKQFHGWLLKFSDKDQRHRGDYKKFPNHVEAFDSKGKSLGIVFQTASPFDTPLKMHDLVTWANEQLESKSLHPLLVIGIFIVVFLAIHPFQDGNGRLSRLLTTLLLLKTGYAFVPYSSLESIIENSKENYYLALRKTQQSFTTDKQIFTPWLTFFLKALQKQKRHLEHKVTREKLLRSVLSPLATQIEALIKEHDRLTMNQLLLLTRANRNTLKKVLASMVKDKYIVRHGKARATWYSLI